MNCFRCDKVRHPLHHSDRAKSSEKTLLREKTRTTVVRSIGPQIQAGFRHFPGSYCRSGSVSTVDVPISRAATPFLLLLDSLRGTLPDRFRRREVLHFQPRRRGPGSGLLSRLIPSGLLRANAAL